MFFFGEKRRRKGRDRERIAAVLCLGLFSSQQGCATTKHRVANRASVDCRLATLEPGKVVTQKVDRDSGQSGAQIIGIVTFDTRPLEGVQVVVTIRPISAAGLVHQETLEFDVLSDAQGRFELSIDAPTRFTVGFYHGTYRPNLTGEFTLDSGQSLKICARMKLDN